jgi:hypothetical protein
MSDDCLVVALSTIYWGLVSPQTVAHYKPPFHRILAVECFIATRFLSGSNFFYRALTIPKYLFRGQLKKTPSKSVAIVFDESFAVSLSRLIHSLTLH